MSQQENLRLASGWHLANDKSREKKEEKCCFFFFLQQQSIIYYTLQVYHIYLVRKKYHEESFII